jgi:predicted metalloprotease
VEQCELREVRRRACRVLSRGYRQRVGIAAALVHAPRLLVLDEPTAGLDPAQVLLFRSLLQSLKGSTAVLLSTHVLAEVEAACDALVVLDRGRVVATGNSVDQVWQQLLRGYKPPKLRLFKGEVQTGCGPASSDVGPFYCPPDQTAYFDTDFFQVLKTQFGSSGGPLAQEYVVAHEYGHHVQNLLGDLGRAQKGAQGATGDGVRSELQADCYAGVWAHYAAITKQPGTDLTYLEPLSDNDIADALSAASSVGDDRIQKQSTGRVNPEQWTHGSSEQRQKWFTVGYQTGDPNKCDTFSARNLS